MAGLAKCDLINIALVHLLTLCWLLCLLDFAGVRPSRRKSDATESTGSSRRGGRRRSSAATGVGMWIHSLFQNVVQQVANPEHVSACCTSDNFVNACGTSDNFLSACGTSDNFVNACCTSDNFANVCCTSDNFLSACLLYV
jgi:hypothetical protein